MRIGHYAPDIWANGGVASYIRRLGEAQVSAGHSVLYLSRTFEPGSEADVCIRVHDDPDLFRQAGMLGLDILHLHKPVSELPEVRIPTVRTMHGNQGSCPSGTRYLARQGKPCDRVYNTAGCLWGRYVDRCGSRRPHSVRFGFERIEKEIHMSGVLPTFTVSAFLKRQMVRAGCQAGNIHVLPSPAPEVGGAYTPASREGPPRFVYAGRVVPQKGIQWLLHALARVDAEVHLDIAGEGYLVGDMQALARRLKIADRLTFHGWLPVEEVAALIREARAVVVPSLWHEPAGLVTLEAAAFGRPVIASRAGGIPEYALEEFALLVSPGDVEGLARGITLFAEEADMADRMGEAGMEAARTRFSMGRFVERQNMLYQESIAGAWFQEDMPTGRA
ncbi:MAG TPA: glycosyltransferase family 4 protein [Rhodothermales bacterium]|nr:glycosyltransferase family 4 protein [Rhodothermales bacterium]